jgi:CBS-domain-containing membrane protein
MLFRKRGSLLLPLIAALGRGFAASAAIGLAEFLARAGGEPMSHVPCVTSIALVTAFPFSEPAKVPAVLGGHVLSAVAGYLALLFFGAGELGAAAGLGGAVTIMCLTRTMHPPAGLSGFLVPFLGLPLAWLLTPLLIGGVLVSAYGVLLRVILPRPMAAASGGAQT